MLQSVAWKCFSELAQYRIDDKGQRLLTQDNVTLIGEFAGSKSSICARLDGLPLRMTC